MTDKPSAIVAGHICLDIYPDMSDNPGDQLLKSFVPGHLLRVGPMSFSTGGSVSNTGLALNKLGIVTKMMGKVGSDFSGQIVQQLLNGNQIGLNEGMIVDSSVSTSYTIVISPPGVDRILFHCPGANDTYGAEDVHYDLLSAADLFHFGYPPLMKRMFEPDGSQLAAIFRRAKETGVTTSLDMAFPDPASAANRADWYSILKLTLPSVDIFMPSIEEILRMIDHSSFEKLQQKSGNGDILPLITPQLLSTISGMLLELGAKIIGIKLGYRGLYIRTAEYSKIVNLGRGQPEQLQTWSGKELWSPCFLVDVVGTAGSGDATIAGFLSALLRGMDLEQALTAAVGVGACCVEAADTLSGILTWDHTMQRIANGWQKQTMDLSRYGWTFNADQQIWANPVIV